MNVRFYNFTKRLNSTKQPTGAYTQKDCKLKENTSLHNPVLQVAGDISTSFTYAYIPDWGKYYFVEDAVSIAKGLCEYTLTEDRMASNKAAIGLTSARVAYASSSYYTHKPDTRCSVSVNKSILGSITNNPVFSATGFYVLTVFNDEAHGVGCSTSYALTQSGIDTVRKWLADDTVFAALTTFFEGSPLDAVMGCVWVPFSFSECPGTGVSDMKIGNRTMNGDSFFPGTGEIKRMQGYPQMQYTHQIDCNLRYTDFRAVEPYTSGTIYLPGVGNMDMNMGDWRGSAKINVSMTCEVITGNVTYLMFRDDGAMVQTATCCVASPCPLGQVTVNSSGAVGALKTAVAGAAGLVINPALGAGAMIAGASGSVLAFNQRAASVSGSVGGRSATIWPYIHHIEYSVDTEDVDDSTGYIQTVGRPVGEVCLISVLSGYVQCVGASVNMAGSEEERSAINQMLNAGFYYE